MEIKMISESYPYNLELKKIHEEMAKKCSGEKEEDEDEEYQTWGLEKNIFLSAYIFRKLMDCHRISDEVTTLNIPVQKTVLKDGVFIDSLNNHKLDEKYSWDKFGEGELNVKTMANYLIHSFVFEFVVGSDKNQFTHIIFNSDKSKNVLFILSLENYLIFLENVYSDDVGQMFWEKKRKKLSDGTWDLSQPREPKKIRRSKFAPKIKNFI